VALRECIAGSRSAAEGDFMTLIGRPDLPEPMADAELYTPDGAFLGIADVWWQRAGVVAEVDSRRYHLSPANYERTVTRHNRMAAHGINVLHFLPDTVKTAPSTVIRSLRRDQERQRPAVSPDRGQAVNSRLRCRPRSPCERGLAPSDPVEPGSVRDDDFEFI
jgi:hypothetical protein